ncbi:MAG: 60S ribosomal protein L31 [Candidatus Aenigmarchaeota archaeon]|nr:60S ribosomal protein L31 [Candidatus Aenigmarchaeota archaeon]
MTEEKIYDIPLRKFFTESGRRQKAPHAVKGLRELLSKKTRSNDVVLSTGINELIWARGVSHPPAKIRVKVRKDGEKVFAELISVTPVEPKKEAEIKKEDVKQPLPQNDKKEQNGKA